MGPQCVNRTPRQAAEIDLTYAGARRCTDISEDEVQLYLQVPIDVLDSSGHKAPVLAALLSVPAAFAF
jgi:hypothetical protein